MRGQWREAATHFERLANCNRWAPAFCTYLAAACLHEDGDRGRAAELMTTVRSLGIKKLGGCARCSRRGLAPPTPPT